MERVEERAAVSFQTHLAGWCCRPRVRAAARRWCSRWCARRRPRRRRMRRGCTRSREAGTAVRRRPSSSTYSIEQRITDWNRPVAAPVPPSRRTRPPRG